MSLTELLAITPIDGRYREDVQELAPYCSEFALINNRVKVECRYLLALEDVGMVQFTSEVRKILRSIPENLTEEEAQLIKDIETKGVPGINNGKKTDHDVKSPELFLKNKCKKLIVEAPENLRDKYLSLEKALELFHIFLTSEDVNNICYSVMLKDAVYKCLIPALVRLEDKLVSMGEQYKDMPMPGRTHGQHAIPTTVGKELMIFCERVAKQLKGLTEISLEGKLNGAIGNYSSFYAVRPEVNWPKFSKAFVESFGLKHNPFTTQIEPHDSMADLFNKIAHINTILLGTDQDMWGYISDGYFVQKKEEGVVGSSTMPQKINPIKFENSETNLGIANALLHYFATKLPVSRFQRDLSDSAAQRWIGTALAACLLSYKNTLRGLNKAEPYKEKLDEELDKHWEVLAEPIQQLLRFEGVSGAYDLLKSMTQGRRWTREDVVRFAISAPVRFEAHDKLKFLTPFNYLGIAPELTVESIERVKGILAEVKTYE